MSRSGETFKPCKTMSSPVFTITVRSRGFMTSCRPNSSFEAPTPPANAVIVSRFAEDLDLSRFAEGMKVWMCGPLCRKSLDIGQSLRTLAHARREEAAARHEFGIKRKPFPQCEAARFRFCAQFRDLR